MLFKDQKTAAQIREASDKYAAPKLSVYGSVTDLTAGGSNGVTESTNKDSKEQRT